LRPDDGVVCIEQRVPVTVADLRGPTRRVHDVGEQHRRKHPIIGHFRVLTGEELGDLLKKLAPRLNEVPHVASGQLNVLRPRYVITDVLAQRRRDEEVVAVLNDEGRHADCGKQRPHVQFGHQRLHESDGPWARRQAFHSSPCRPDLLVPRHVRQLPDGTENLLRYTHCLYPLGSARQRRARDS
jgi:hypothetical protein